MKLLLTTLGIAAVFTVVLAGGLAMAAIVVEASEQGVHWPAAALVATLILGMSSMIAISITQD